MVDTEQTGKLIIQKGQLQFRTTMVPLNKIRGQQIEAEKLRIAEQLVKFCETNFNLFEKWNKILIGMYL